MGVGVGSGWSGAGRSGLDQNLQNMHLGTDIGGSSMTHE